MIKNITTSLLVLASASFSTLSAQTVVNSSNQVSLDVDAPADPAPADAPALETWKKADGSSFEATYVSSKKGEVIFKDKDGKEIKVKKKELSKESKKKVKKLGKSAAVKK